MIFPWLCDSSKCWKDQCWFTPTCLLWLAAQGIDYLLNGFSCTYFLCCSTSIFFPSQSNFYFSNLSAAICFYYKLFVKSLNSTLQAKTFWSFWNFYFTWVPFEHSHSSSLFLAVPRPMKKTCVGAMQLQNIKWYYWIEGRKSMKFMLREDHWGRDRWKILKETLLFFPPWLIA